MHRLKKGSPSRNFSHYVAVSSLRTINKFTSNAMKKFICILVATMLALPVFCQEENLQKLENLEKNTEIKTDTGKIVKSDAKLKQDTVIVEVGDELFSVKEIGDETRIKLGKKEFRIVENDDGVVVFKSLSKDSHKRKNDRFKGHLGGLELGLNSLLTDFWSTTLKPEDNYFNLNTAKSYTWNISLPCLSLGFTRHFGIASTLGINFNKYRFDGNNSIVEDENGVVGPSYPAEGITYSKSKLVTTYATLPVIFEAQIPLSNSNHTINLGAGVIGAAKLGSHTKVVYYTGGKEKEKHKDDFSLNTFRWGATGRIGYEFFQIYGTCYFTSMFESEKGPELYPFEIGIAFTFNN
jgi:hypothetical protein